MNALEAYHPRSTGRRSSDARRWWVTMVLVLLQGGFVGAWKIQFDAWQNTLEVERKLRDAQTTALVNALKDNTQSIRDLRNLIERQP